VREWAHVEPGLEEIFLAATNHRLEDSPVALGRAGPAGE
jgi:hypothetical protein